MNCIQCNTEATGKFCTNCGQKQTIARLTFKTFLHDFISRIYGLDGAVPNTIIGLWKQPQIVCQEYIKGIRGKYVGPVGYYFLMFTLYFIVIAIFDIDMAEYSGTNELTESMREVTGDEVNVERLEFQALVQEKVSQNIQYFTILFFPIFYLWAKLFFKKASYNLLETIVFLFFVNAQMLIINIAGLMVYAATGESYKMILAVIGISYFSWAAAKFYYEKVSFMRFLKSLFYYIVSFISFFIGATIILLISLILIKLNQLAIIEGQIPSPSIPIIQNILQ